jgi:YfiH family protein
MSDPKPIKSEKLSRVAGVRHAFFTREGGVSQGLYASLNIGRGSKDAPADVAENRRRCAVAMGVAPEALNSCYQIHSTIARVAEAPWGDERPEGDAIVTATPGIACGALSADCAPVLFADPQARVVASAHAGWKGALDGVVQSTVSAMQSLGADRRRIVAAVGPCIGPDSYEVGVEFLARFAAHDPGSERFFKPAQDADKRLFDLPSFVLWRLEQAGVGDAEWVGCDTCADEARFFSNRRAFKRGEADYGRLLSAIALA